jgi:hypothetical protein
MLVVSLISVAVSAATAKAGFKAAQWGMSPEQVAVAMPDAAPLNNGSSAESFEGKKIGNIGSYESNGHRFRTVYYYDERGLSMVALNARPKECAAIYQDLVVANGRPYRTSEQMMFSLFIWHNSPENNRLRLMASPKAGICTLYYERLDDYKAADDAQAAQGR